MKTKNKILGLALVIVLLATQVGMVAADDGVTDPTPAPMPTDAPPNAPLTQPAVEDGAVGVNQALEPNPYGCVGRTDYPHKSTHVPGTVNVVAYTTCTVFVPQLYVKTRLYRWVCWLGICWYSAYGPESEKLQYGGNQVYTNSAGQCITGWYKGESYHYVIGADGNRYEAWTSQEAYVNC